MRDLYILVPSPPFEPSLPPLTGSPPPFPFLDSSSFPSNLPFLAVPYPSSSSSFSFLFCVCLSSPSFFLSFSCSISFLFRALSCPPVHCKRQIKPLAANTSPPPSLQLPPVLSIFLLFLSFPSTFVSMLPPRSYSSPLPFPSVILSPAPYALPPFPLLPLKSSSYLPFYLLLFLLIPFCPSLSYPLFFILCSSSPFSPFF